MEKSAEFFYTLVNKHSGVRRTFRYFKNVRYIRLVLWGQIFLYVRNFQRVIRSRETLLRMISFTWKYSCIIFLTLSTLYLEMFKLSSWSNRRLSASWAIQYADPSSPIRWPHPPHRLVLLSGLISWQFEPVPAINTIPPEKKELYALMIV